MKCKHCGSENFSIIRQEKYSRKKDGSDKRLPGAGDILSCNECGGATTIKKTAPATAITYAFDLGEWEVIENKAPARKTHGLTSAGKPWVDVRLINDEPGHVEYTGTVFGALARSIVDGEMLETEDGVLVGELKPNKYYKFDFKFNT